MNAILNFFKQNKVAAGSLTAAVGVVVLALVMTGCSIGSMIKHNVPAGIRPFNDGMSKVSLDDSPFVLESYLSDVERNVQQYVQNSEKAALVADLLASVMTIGLEELGNSPLPGGAIIAGMLAGFGGLMTRKPGTAKEIAEQKMASFNAGQDRATEAIKGLVTEEALREIVAKIKKEVTDA